MNSSDSREPIGPDAPTDSGANFTRTHWSVILMAAQNTAEGTTALESLCRTYWRPVYAFLRRKGYRPADSQDLTQEFFFRLIRQRSFASADPKRGRFRSFLLGALQHFLADEWDKARAAKRGGGQALISWDAEAESTYQEKVPRSLPPDQVFAQQWAWTLVNTALERMSADHAAEGKAHQFELLKRFLTEEPHAQSYDQLSAELGANRNTIAKNIQRLRQCFRLLVRQAALQTVSNPADLEDEVHQLFA